MSDRPETKSPEEALWDRKYDEGIRSAWFSNQLVVEELNRRITGINKFWLAWVFEDLLEFRPQRVLSIGCGDGAHELIIARNGWAKHVTAFDVSQAGIKAARAVAESQGLAASFSVATFDSFTAAPDTEPYDMVLFIGSLHHVREMEAMLDKVRNALAGNGVVLVNEYVGPCYGIFSDERLGIINRVLSSLAPEFKLAPESQRVNPTIEAVLSYDPSESTRSALIPSFLSYYFKACVTRNFGGALLHPLFDHLNSGRLADGSPESNTIVRLLIETENLLTDAGLLPNDFLFGLYQKG